MQSEQKKEMAAAPEEIKSVREQDYYLSVFADNVGPIALLASFLEVGELHNLILNKSSTRHPVMGDDEVWRQFLKAHIGPNPNELRNPGETYKQAYKRHKEIIAALPKIEDISDSELEELHDTEAEQVVNAKLEEITKRLNDYPQYHVHVIVDILILFSIFQGSDFRDYSTHSERIMDSILNNNAIFASVFDSVEDLSEFLKTFPAINPKRVLQHVLTNIADFSRLFPRVRQFSYFIKNNPDHAEQVLKGVLENKDIFSHLFVALHKFSYFIKNNTGYAQRVLQGVLENKNLFAHLFPTMRELFHFIHTFPIYTQQVLTSVLENKDLFIYLFPSIFELSDFIEVNSDLAHQVLRGILENKNFFIYLFPTLSELSDFITIHPAYTKELLKGILDNKDYFVHLFPTVHELSRFMKKLPAYVQPTLQSILENKNLFDHFFSEPVELSCFIITHPTHAQQILKNILENKTDFSYDYVQKILQCVLADKIICSHIFPGTSEAICFAKAYPEHRNIIFEYAPTDSARLITHKLHSLSASDANSSGEQSRDHKVSQVPISKSAMRQNNELLSKIFMEELRAPAKAIGMFNKASPQSSSSTSCHTDVKVSSNNVASKVGYMNGR